MPLFFNSAANMQSSMEKYDLDFAQVKKEGFTVGDNHHLLNSYHLISTQLTWVSNSTSAISSSPQQESDVIKSFQNYIEDFQKLNSLAKKEPLFGNQLNHLCNVSKSEVQNFMTSILYSPHTNNKDSAPYKQK